jgi:hypothetical protein
VTFSEQPIVENLNDPWKQIIDPDVVAAVMQPVDGVPVPSGKAATDVNGIKSQCSAVTTYATGNQAGTTWVYQYLWHLLNVQKAEALQWFGGSWFNGNTAALTKFLAYLNPTRWLKNTNWDRTTAQTPNLIYDPTIGYYWNPEADTTLHSDDLKSFITARFKASIFTATDLQTFPTGTQLYIPFGTPDGIYSQVPGVLIEDCSATVPEPIPESTVAASNIAPVMADDVFGPGVNYCPFKVIPDMDSIYYTDTDDMFAPSAELTSPVRPATRINYNAWQNLSHVSPRAFKVSKTPANVVLIQGKVRWDGDTDSYPSLYNMISKGLYSLTTQEFQPYPSLDPPPSVFTSGAKVAQDWIQMWAPAAQNTIKDQIIDTHVTATIANAVSTKPYLITANTTTDFYPSDRINLVWANALAAGVPNSITTSANIDSQFTQVGVPCKGNDAAMNKSAWMSAPKECLPALMTSTYPIDEDDQDSALWTAASMCPYMQEPLVYLQAASTRWPVQDATSTTTDYNKILASMWSPADVGNWSSVGFRWLAGSGGDLLNWFDVSTQTVFSILRPLSENVSTVFGDFVGTDTIGMPLSTNTFGAASFACIDDDGMPKNWDMNVEPVTTTFMEAQNLTPSLAPFQVSSNPQTGIFTITYEYPDTVVPGAYMPTITQEVGPTAADPDNVFVPGPDCLELYRVRWFFTIKLRFVESQSGAEPPDQVDPTGPWWDDYLNPSRYPSGIIDMSMWPAAWFDSSVTQVTLDYEPSAQLLQTQVGPWGGDLIVAANVSWGGDYSNEFDPKGIQQGIFQCQAITGMDQVETTLTVGGFPCSLINSFYLVSTWDPTNLLNMWTNPDTNEPINVNITWPSWLLEIVTTTAETQTLQWATPTLDASTQRYFLCNRVDYTPMFIWVNSAANEPAVGGVNYSGPPNMFLNSEGQISFDNASAYIGAPGFAGRQPNNYITKVLEQNMNVVSTHQFFPAIPTGGNAYEGPSSLNSATPYGLPSTYSYPEQNSNRKRGAGRSFKISKKLKF